MKFLILFLMSFSVMAGSSPLKGVDKDILSEERLKAVNEFETEYKAECTSGDLSAEDCAQLDSFVKAERYNAKLMRYGHIQAQADALAVSRHSERSCVNRLQAHFTSKGYPFNGSETCSELESALAVHEPPAEE